MSVIGLLGGVPAPAVYALIGVVVTLESLGAPLRGETAVIAGALLSGDPRLGLSAWGVALVAFVGAVVGDSLGYAVGERVGAGLLDRLTRRFPRHFSAVRVGYARHVFARYGMAAVFGGRFVALLRMLSGPLAGSLGLHYPRFLLANAAGAAVWAGGITILVGVLGSAADRWIADAGWALLAAVLVVGALLGRLAARAFDTRAQAYADAHPDTVTS